MEKKVKIAMIGAGSVNFCPATVTDVLLNDRIMGLEVTIALMDIDGEALEVSGKFSHKVCEELGRTANIYTTTDLDDAVENADFVVTAIEKERYHYWSEDFHIPRRYGFRQVYGENGGPGGMFHTLRNLEPILHIAHRIEKLCPDAWLINYTNPEAKLVEAVSRLTKIKAVGVCHGFSMGLDTISQILEIPKDQIEATGYGLNHFGWYTELKDKLTGEDLYPLLQKKEREAHWLAKWDEVGLSRIMYRLYGLFPYPGTNHIGEYIAWSDAFLASTKIQFFFDPVNEKPWKNKKTPSFVYNFCDNPTGIAFSYKDPEKQEEYKKRFGIEEKQYRESGEYGVLIMEAILFDLHLMIPSLNMPNEGTMPGIMQGMCVEGPCMVDALGIHPQSVKELPVAITAMINHQGAIHRLVIEAYQKKSRNLLLQALLLDPTVSNYDNAVALINEMFDLQKDILPELKWQ